MQKQFSILILLTCITQLHSAEPGEITPGTKRAIEKFEADLIELKSKYERELAHAKEELEKRLEYELKTLTRNGKLETAKAIKKILDDAKSRTGIEKLDYKGKPVDAHFLVAKLRPTDYVVSHSWKSPSGPFRFIPGEKLVVYRDSVGRYRIEGNRIFYTLKSGLEHWLVLSPNPKVLLYKGTEKWTIIEDAD